MPEMVFLPENHIYIYICDYIDIVTVAVLLN